MIRAGKIVATHGVSGAVIFTHVTGATNWLRKGHVLMVEMQKGSLIPYFVSGCKATNTEEYIVELEDITTPQAARILIKKNVYVDEKLLSTLSAQSPLLWIGFNIVDAGYGALGPLEDVIQTGAQWIGKLTYKGNEVLIPLVKETMGSIDIKNKTLKTNIPQGLLEVYE